MKPIKNDGIMADDSEEEEVEMDSFSEESSGTESSCSSDYIKEIEERLNQLSGDVDHESARISDLRKLQIHLSDSITDQYTSTLLDDVEEYQLHECARKKVKVKRRRLIADLTNVKNILRIRTRRHDNIAKQLQRSVPRHSAKTITSGSSTSTSSAYDYHPGFSQRKPRKNKKLIRLLNTMLLRAVMRSDVSEVQRLLQTKVNPSAVCRTKYFSTCHIAALHDTDLVSLLLERGAKRNMPDESGRTPLHIAAWSGSLKPLLALLGLPSALQKKLEGNSTTEVEEEIKKLTAKADLTPNNKKKIEKYKSIDRSLKDILDARCHYNSVIRKLPKHYFDNKDHSCEKISLPEMHQGWTPLHAAASTARVLCCRVLLAAGADPCAKTYDGLTPLDVAGSQFDHDQPDGSALPKTAFTDIVNLLANEERRNGEMAEPKNKWLRLTFRNTSLHTAVELESTQDTVLLLQSGVSPMIVNSAMTTPYHLCVHKRNKELLQILVDHLSKEDPPRYAPRCGDGFSVLHYAVQINWFEGVCVCLNSKASASMEPEDNGETPLHTAAALGNLNILKEITRFANANNMINAKNGDGETALFKAIQNGQTESVKLLLQEGALIKITSPSGFNVFHIAAQAGNVDILKVLLDHDEKFTRKNINTRTFNYKGFGPIHFALENNHVECVKLLLSKNASIDLKTNNNLTVLHVAVSKNNLEFARFIVKSQPSQIHDVDDFGWSPLHTASAVRARDAIKFLILEGADLSVCTTGPKKNHNTAVEMLMNNISKPTEFLESIFDTCICTQKSKHDQDAKRFDLYGDLIFQDPDLEVVVDYSILSPNTETQNHYSKLNVIDALIRTGNSFGQKNLLIHPLVESFICLKWKALIPFFYAILFIYGLFALTLTIFVMTEFGYKDMDSAKKIEKPAIWNTTFWANALYVTIVIVMIQELIFLTVNLRNYVLHIESWIKLSSVILAIMLPKLIEKCQNLSTDSVDWARHVATIAILVCWLYMIFLLSRFPKWGCYVLMFQKVFSNVVKILLTFACLVIGFALSFMIQYHHKKFFENFWTAVLKTMVMMTSEFDYDDLVKSEEMPDIKTFAVIRIVFFIFLILAAIVLMNLMVGVSVNDLNNLEVTGRIMQLEKQVELVNNICSTLETLLFKRVFWKLFPKSWLKFSNKLVLKPYEPEHYYKKVIATHVRDAIYAIAIARQKSSQHSDCDKRVKNEECSYGVNISRQDYKAPEIKQTRAHVPTLASRPRCLNSPLLPKRDLKQQDKKHEEQIDGKDVTDNSKAEMQATTADSDEVPIPFNQKELTIDMSNV